MRKRLCVFFLTAVMTSAVNAGLIGYLTTSENGGLISGGQSWNADAEGYRVDWVITLNPDRTWHYQYTFSNQVHEPLRMDTSHIIISVSENLSLTDVFNFSFDVDVDELAISTYGLEPGNPGFPAGDVIYGLKINLINDQMVVAFDSVRQPMWGDFYAKGGGQPKNFAYNSDLGTAVANLHDYLGVPVDAFNQPLSKVLVPNTIPEPATLLLLGVGGLFMLKCKS